MGRRVPGVAPRRYGEGVGRSSLPCRRMRPYFSKRMRPGSTVIQRFDFGRVGEIRPPSDRSLDEIDGENVFFTLKVVDCTVCFGRLLGIAETRAERRVVITPEHGARELANLLAALPVIHQSLPLLPRAYELSSQMRIGAFDCLYVALAAAFLFRFVVCLAYEATGEMRALLLLAARRVVRAVEVAIHSDPKAAGITEEP